MLAHTLVHAFIAAAYEHEPGFHSQLDGHFMGQHPALGRKQDDLRPAPRHACGHGFGGREDGYLIGSDRICTPLAVTSGAASGTPSCKKASADEIIALSVKSAVAVRGADASHKADARGRTLTVSAKDDTVLVTWQSTDAISKVEAVYVSKYQRLVAVEPGSKAAEEDQFQVRHRVARLVCDHLSTRRSGIRIGAGAVRAAARPQTSSCSRRTASLAASSAGVPSNTILPCPIT